MLEAIIRIRACLHFKGKWCKNFQATEDMFQFNNAMYYRDLNNLEDSGMLLELFILLFSFFEKFLY